MGWKMNMNGRKLRIKIQIVAYLEGLFQYFPGETEKKHDNFSWDNR
jgi:hypothetical protein